MLDRKKQQLGNYLILEKIAQGGMAEIYKAKTTDPKGIDRLVVIKRILPHISSNPEYVSMLVDEAKIAVQFTHGNIAQVYDLGRVNDDYFIVMEFVDGKSFSQIIKDFTENKLALPLDVILFCIAEVCQGLDYIHSKTVDGKSLGVVHRDISPQNIIISYSGTVKIIDFGVAKSDVKLEQTESGVLKGKFAYMSPEQTYGQKIDARSDIFSLGILLWELLTQKRLFKKKANQDTIKSVRKEEAKAPSSFRPDIPPEIDRIILKALHKKPARRYQQASEMAQDIMRFLYQYNPDFKSIDIAKFLFQNFGAMPDEEGIESSIPEIVEAKKSIPLIPPKKSGVIYEDDEPTLVEEKIKKKWPWYIKLPVISFSFIIGLILLFFIYVFIMELPYLNKAILNIHIIPNDSQLIVNQQEVKLSNGEFENNFLPEKDILISVHHNGYHSFEKTIQLKKKEQKILNINLDKKFPPFGSLMIKSNPEGALVFVDGVIWNEPTPAKILRLDHDKEYKIGISLDGYQSVEKEIKIIGGRLQIIETELIADLASLQIHTNPVGAKVVINGEERGLTPIELNELPAKEHLEIKLLLEGYEGEIQEISLEPGEKRGLSVKLTKE